MLLNMLKSFVGGGAVHYPNTLPNEYIKYAACSYPNNHNYKISNGRLIPKRGLAFRYNQLKKLYPDSLTSLVCIGCSKGYFVFSASALPSCANSLGIDISEYDIHFCRQVKSYLQDVNSQFELIRLHELAENIDKFNGPFQTVLIINTYQYLYFGSGRSADCYLDHDIIFKNLRRICSQRIIFNNRVNLDDCRNRENIAQANEESKANYSKEKILEAASQYFHFTDHGSCGSYPLWTFDVKE